VLRAEEMLAERGAPPESRVAAGVPRRAAVTSTTLDDALPSDLVWGHLASSGMTVVAGRGGRPIHERERVRISLLTRLADALVR